MEGYVVQNTQSQAWFGQSAVSIERLRMGVPRKDLLIGGTNGVEVLEQA